MPEAGISGFLNTEYKMRRDIINVNPPESSWGEMEQLTITYNNIEARNGGLK